MKRSKKNIIKALFLSAICLLTPNRILFAQINNPVFSVRVSLQSDFQKADFKDTQFPNEFKEQSATQMNLGIDLLSEKRIHNNWSVYAGIGYFRNKFNFKRAYDHQLLNIGRDSLPVGTTTSDYTFHLLRLPIGISYQLLKKSRYNFNIGIENIINFSFLQVYNGQKPFPDANNKYSRFGYYGNSIHLFCRISRQVSPNSLIQIEPYVRLLNRYKREDPFLFENNSKPYTRTIDAIGLSFKYSTNFKPKNYKP